jgi:hypothetical protein
MKKHKVCGSLMSIPFRKKIDTAKIAVQDEWREEFLSNCAKFDLLEHLCSSLERGVKRM